MVVGVGGKADVHAQGKLHSSVLLLVRREDGGLVLYRRHAEQSFPHCLDLFGGHYEPRDAPHPRNTALREAAEEIRFIGGGMRLQLDPQWFIPLSEPFELESTDSLNRERSTLFGIQLPPGVSAEAEGDITDSGHAVPAVAEAHGFAQVLALAESEPQSLADGLARVAIAARGNAGLRQRIESFLTADR